MIHEPEFRTNTASYSHAFERAWSFLFPGDQLMTRPARKRTSTACTHTYFDAVCVPLDNAFSGIISRLISPLHRANFEFLQGVQAHSPGG